MAHDPSRPLSPDELTRLFRIEQICDAFESALKSGGKPQVEQYVQALAEPERSEAARELSALEQEYRAKQAETPAGDDTATRIGPAAEFASTVVRPADSSRPESGPAASGGKGATVISPVPNASHLPEVGERIGNYELLGEIARGGMGVVYKARQAGLNRIVALKTIRSGQFADSHEIQRFHTEAEAAAGLDHDHIVPIYEVGEHAGRHFFSMAYIEGQSLAAKLKNGPLPAREAAELMRLVARAVHYAHTRGIIHRDLKPGNVLLDSTGRPHVTDFGLARHYQAENHLTETGQVLGTPSFMSPEQALGQTNQISPAADVYSLGAVLYNLLTGRPPFQAATQVETLRQVIDREPVPPRALNPSVPLDLETIVLKCLEKVSTRRFNSTEEFAEELGRYLRGEPIVSRPIGRLARAWRWGRRRPTAAALIATSGLAVVALIATYVVSVKLTAARQVADANQKKVDAQRSELAAREETAATLKYTNEVHQAKAAMRTPVIGRYLKSLEGLQRAAVQESPARDAMELRNLAAECLTGFDLRLTSDFSRGLDPNNIAFAPDGKSLAVVEISAGNQISIAIRVHSVPDGKLLRELSAPSDANTIRQPWIHDGGRSLQFRPDGKSLALGTRGGWVHLWDLTRVDKSPTTSWQPPKPDEANRHHDPIWELSFAADGKTLYTVNHEFLRAWDVSGATPREVRGISSRSGIRTFCVVPEAGALAILGHTLAIIDERDFHALRDFGEFNLQERHHLYTARDGRTIALAADARVSLIDVRTGATLRTLVEPALGTTHDGNIVSADFHPDGSLVVTTGTDKRFKIWETASGKLVLNQPRQSRSAIWAQFSPDGKHLAVTGDIRVELYEVTGAGIRTTISQQTRPVIAMDVSADGASLACFTEEADPDQMTVTTAYSLWDLNANRLKTYRAVSEPLVFGRKDDRPGLSFDPKGRFLAYTGFYADTTYVDLKDALPMPVYDALLAREGTVVVDEDKFDLGPPDRADRRPDPGALNGTAALLPGSDEFRFSLKTAEVPGLDVQKKNWFVFVRMRTRDRSTRGMRYLILNRKGGADAEPRIVQQYNLDQIPDDEYHWYYVDYLAPHWVALAGESKSMTLQIGRFQGVREAFIDRVAFVPAQLSSMAQLQFGPEGERLWSVVSRDRIVAWSVPQRTIAAEFDNSKNPLTNGATGISSFAVSEKWVLLGCNDGAPRLMRADDFKVPPQMWRLPFTQDPITAVAFDREASLAAVGTFNARLSVASVPDGATIAELKGHQAQVSSLLFSPDGRLLISASQDATVRFWWKTAKSWEEALVLSSDSGPVDSIRLTPDGRTLLILVKGESGVRLVHIDRLRAELAKLGLDWLDDK
jgi:WD40 repeat protein/tRNA A-37 threonylcarbamoyl transferase component Bud32